MKPWFIWNGKNSDELGLWIARLPKITRAPERYDTVKIPGKAGSLILREGDDVYDSYLKECTVQTIRTNQKMQEILDWLSGDGELVFSNEDNRLYKGAIVADFSFDKISNDIIQAKIPFFVEPFKSDRYPESAKITGASGVLTNPGDVASKPIVSIKNGGTNTITIGTQAMTFNSVSGTIVVDCDAKIITIGGELWTGTFSGEFWKIPTGQVTVTQTSNAEITIQPNWRWR